MMTVPSDTPSERMYQPLSGILSVAEKGNVLSYQIEISRVRSQGSPVGMVTCDRNRRKVTNDSPNSEERGEDKKETQGNSSRAERAGVLIWHRIRLSLQETNESLYPEQKETFNLS